MGRVRWVVPAARIPHLTPPLSAPKGGEGDFEFSTYCLQHALDIFHHIPIPEPDYPIAVSLDLAASIVIIVGNNHVLSAVELDYQLRGRTGEIHDVSADWVLPAIPLRKTKLAQFPPQPLLGFGHVPPQASSQRRSSLDDHSISIRTAPYSTGCASATRICAMRPGRCARIWFITFIASMISKGCPSATESPSRTNGGSPGCGAR